MKTEITIKTREVAIASLQSVVHLGYSALAAALEREHKARVEKYGEKAVLEAYAQAINTPLSADQLLENQFATLQLAKSFLQNGGEL